MATGRSRWSRRTTLVTAVGVVVMVALDAVGATPAAASACCFTNPQFAGGCVVQAGKGETCASIQTYLNDPRSQGKTYCGNTSIKGGWKQVRCTKPRRSSP